MISPFATDEELIRGCALVESSNLRTMADRLARRVDQMDRARRMADSPSDDPAQTLADIVEALKRD